MCCVLPCLILLTGCTAGTPSSETVSSIPIASDLVPAESEIPESEIPESEIPESEIPELNLSESIKVAFLGDQGIGIDAKAVLSLVREEGTNLLLLQGDLGYDPATATKWDQNITDALGRDFPVLTVVGNHENHEWPLYQQLIEQRISRAVGLTCDGLPGVKASCKFGNLHVVQVAVGVFEVPGVKSRDNYAEYIRSSFENSDSPWRVCSWHKNQQQLQVYRKGNATGWDVFDACLDAGAMVAMGHAHTYSRTYLLNDFESQSVEHLNDEMLLEPGKSFAFVSGLGGRNIKAQERTGDWFASVYTASQGATHGALFCTLMQTSAECYYKAIDGAVPDRFTLLLNQKVN